MKILELHVEGFRSLKNVTWKPGDLNVVIGPNASGKSNLLKLLEMLSVAADGRLSRYVANQGGFQSMIWDGKGADEAIRVTVSVDSISAEGAASIPLTYSAMMLSRRPSGFFFIIDSIYQDSTLDIDSKDQVVHYYRSNDGYRLSETGKMLADIAPGTLSGIPADETLMSQMRGPFVSNRYVQTFQRYMSAWMAYQGLDLGPNSDIRSGSTASHDLVVRPDGQNLANVINTLEIADRGFADDIQRAMSVAFVGAYDRLAFPPVAGGRIALNVLWKGLDQATPPWQLSDGTLRFLYLVAVLANPDPPPLIAIDEPESGLHPDMLPIIAELAVGASRRTQVIFTTHSVQFLDAFKVTNTLPTVSVTRWESGETFLSTLEENELQPWLERYSLGSLFNSGTLEAIA